jgi:hypothetical protein
MWRQPPRNVRLSYTRVNGKRVVKYRALLPLGNLLSPYRIGDFLNEEVRPLLKHLTPIAKRSFTHWILKRVHDMLH